MLKYFPQKKKKRTPQQLHYIVFYKPFNVLCQFTDNSIPKRAILSDFGNFPSDVYPVGRLDFDSEGLLLLTNDNILKHKLLSPKFEHPRTYLVQVEKIPDNTAIEKLQKGVVIEGKKTKPAKVELLLNEPELPPRNPPIRFRKYIPTSWLKITLTEGRNRQVRKMTACVGHPTLRLVRITFGNITLDSLVPGEMRKLSEEEIKFLKNSENQYLST